MKKAEIQVEDEKDADFLSEEFDGHEIDGAKIKISKRNFEVNDKKEEAGESYKLKFKWYIS